MKRKDDFGTLIWEKLSFKMEKQHNMLKKFVVSS